MPQQELQAEPAPWGAEDHQPSVALRALRAQQAPTAWEHPVPDQPDGQTLRAQEDRRGAALRERTDLRASRQQREPEGQEDLPDGEHHHQPELGVGVPGAPPGAWPGAAGNTLGSP